MISNQWLTRDPICGKEQEPGKGIEKEGRWYCSERCVKEHDFRRTFSSGKKNMVVRK
ncbi:hypothetical protein HYT55_04605 [Candidatus Woesearchaeota archaeon]|nr:hypothetical protein [Candidatus Woesearchaeota archaeon]